MIGSTGCDLDKFEDAYECDRANYLCKAKDFEAAAIRFQNARAAFLAALKDYNKLVRDDDAGKFKLIRLEKDEDHSDMKSKSN